jgi:hypothetical protein
MKKICSKCKQEKDLSEFYNDKRAEDGKYSACKKCADKWKERNLDYRKKYVKKWREKNPDYFKEYFKRHPEKGRIAYSAWAKRNPEKAKLKNRKAAKKMSFKRRTRYLKFGGWPIKEEVFNRLVKKQFILPIIYCPYCLTNKLSIDNLSSYPIDHIYPLSKFPENSDINPNQISNLLICCKECNLKKQAKSLGKFFKSLTFLDNKEIISFAIEFDDFLKNEGFHSQNNKIFSETIGQIKQFLIDKSIEKIILNNK